MAHPVIGCPICGVTESSTGKVFNDTSLAQHMRDKHHDPDPHTGARARRLEHRAMITTTYFNPWATNEEIDKELAELGEGGSGSAPA